MLAGQVATLRLQIVKKLDIVGGYYQWTLPVSLYPDLTKHGARQDGLYNYEFSYQVLIASEGRISGVSMPEEAEIIEQNDENTRIRIQCNETSRSIDIYYRTADMMVPQLLYAEDPNGSGEIACAASLIPTFDAVPPEGFFEVLEDEEPESLKVGQGPDSDYHFIFLIDRSGSMGGSRMTLACDALTLFMRSLPEGCSFSIISFGSKFSSDGDKVSVYNNETKNKAIEQIAGFDADFGGTNILEPLAAA